MPEEAQSIQLPEINENPQTLEESEKILDGLRKFMNGADYDPDKHAKYGTAYEKAIVKNTEIKQELARKQAVVEHNAALGKAYDENVKPKLLAKGFDWKSGDIQHAVALWNSEIAAAYPGGQVPQDKIDAGMDKLYELLEVWYKGGKKANAEAAPAANAPSGETDADPSAVADANPTDGVVAQKTAAQEKRDAPFLVGERGKELLDPHGDNRLAVEAWADPNKVGKLVEYATQEYMKAGGKQIEANIRLQQQLSG